MRKSRTSWTVNFFTSVSGPMASVRCCVICGHIEKFPKGVQGVGRGYGLAQGSKSQGRMIQHIKAEHPDAENIDFEISAQNYFSTTYRFEYRGKTFTYTER